ncbi:transposase [Actinoplanes sp. NPDC026670]|uniref:transposase n=1 Tax=Actinoplanes sp. NPDC026670 TaxID=3154700 RepID=UPI0033C26EC7
MTATATCTAFGAVTDDGVPIPAPVLLERVTWLSALVRQMTTELLAARWDAGSLAALVAGVGPDGRELPSNGWMAMRRLGWTATALGGVRVSDRVRRAAEEHAARLLRLAVHREQLVQAITGTWPADPLRRTAVEWQALWAALPAGVTRAEVRNRTRQITTHLREHGSLPVSVTDLEAPPAVSGQILLAACDKQQVTVQRDPDRPDTHLLLRVLLPICEQPANSRDWQWLTLPVRLPPTVPAAASVHTPTLRPVDGRVRVDVPWRIVVPAVRVKGHARALGLDWGNTTLLTGSIARLGQDRAGRRRVLADNHPLRFDATGISAKLLRLRTTAEQLRAKTDQHARLLTGRPDPGLQARHDLLTREHTRVQARIRRLNKALAWAAARWAVDHALTARVSVVYIEDLTTLETRGLGRSLNRRLGAHVRGQVFDALRHLAAKAGIAVVTVPARGTSAGCPRCGRALRHVQAPDRLTVRGHKWAHCPACGLSADRDHAASQRIAARGLLGQTHTMRTRAGTLAIRTTVDGPVRAVRDKTMPTPPRPRRGARVSSPAPSRHRVPAPTTTANTGVLGQRPAGRPSPTRHTPGQKSTTRSSSRPGRTCGRAEVSRGFHRHVTATPVTPRHRPAPRLNKPKDL